MDSVNSNINEDYSLRRNLWGWYFFDFANSILIINGGLYFPQWIVIDNGVSDFWYNLILIISSIALLLTAPILGSISDRFLGRRFFLLLTNLLMFLATMLVGLSGLFITDKSIRVLISLISFFVILYTYQLSLVFYNSILGDIVSRNKYSNVSGVGLAFGWIGGIIGILMVLPFVQGRVPLFQPAGRVQNFIPSAIFFAIFMGISLFMLRDNPLNPFKKKKLLSIGTIYSDTLADLKNIASNNETVFYFLLSYLLFSDAVLTIQDNSPIYLEAVMKIGDDGKAAMFIMLLMTAAVGGISSGFVARKYGFKPTLKGILCSWVIVLIFTGITSNSTLFIFLFGIIGLLFGGVWNISRVLFLNIIPSNKRGEYFGIYSSYERFASILAPLIWGGTVSLLVKLGDVRYRIALILMAILIAASILFLRKIKINI